MVKYPKCRPFKGMEKVRCLVDSILSDAYNHYITPDKAKARLIYLIALNRYQQWGPEELVRKMVYAALAELNSELGLKLGRRARRSLEEALPDYDVMVSAV
jgi:hypothetical protein